MRLVEVKLKCGWQDCSTVGVEGEGDVLTRTVAIDSNKPREIDLCQTHSAELDELMIPLMQDGRLLNGSSGSSSNRSSNSKRKRSKTTTVEASSAPQFDELVCQVTGCDRDGRPMKSKTGMAQHVIKSHGYANLADYYAEHSPSDTD